VAHTLQRRHPEDDMTRDVQKAAMWMMALGLGACDLGGVERVEDHGSACLLGDVHGTTSVLAGEAVSIAVDFGCIGEHTLIDSDCIVTTAEGVLEVSAWAEYTQTQEQLRLPSCTSPAVTCTAEGLDAGTYTLVYAGNEVDFDVPSESETAVCTAEASR
jgi:hypothetical protein